MTPERQEEMLRMFGEFRAEQTTLDFETKRNADNAGLFEAIIREVYPDVTFVAAGHHIMFMRQGQPIPGEFASADTLIFDHHVAKTIWGEGYRSFLMLLAEEPPEHRDHLLNTLYYERTKP